MPVYQEIWMSTNRSRKNTHFDHPKNRPLWNLKSKPTPFPHLWPCGRLSQKSKVASANVKVETPKAENKASQRKEETLPFETGGLFLFHVEFHKAAVFWILIGSRCLRVVGRYLRYCMREFYTWLTWGSDLFLSFQPAAHRSKSWNVKWRRWSRWSRRLRSRSKGGETLSALIDYPWNQLAPTYSTLQTWRGNESPKKCWPWLQQKNK